MTSTSAAPQQGFLDVPGGRLYYEVEGDGHPLTLIHAGLANLRMWDGQMPGFAERHRVIRYDTRGFGRTTTEDVEFSNRDDLRALLDHLGVERTHLLGLSRGSMIATDFTLESPQRVSALVWVAGGVGGYDGPEPPDELKRTFAEMERLWDAKDWEPLAEVEMRLWVDGPGQSPERIPEIRDQVKRWSLDTYAATNGMEGKPQPLDPPAAGRLAEIAIPVLAIWGDIDEPSGQAAGEYFAANVRGARRQVFEGVAHMVNMERPAAFERLVLDFLAEVDARR
jgi:3-oxoadipate enol-lactonase